MARPVFSLTELVKAELLAYDVEEEEEEEEGQRRRCCE